MVNISAVTNVIGFAIVLSVSFSVWICIITVAWGAEVGTVIAGNLNKLGLEAAPLNYYSGILAHKTLCP